MPSCAEAEPEYTAPVTTVARAWTDDPDAKRHGVAPLAASRASIVGAVAERGVDAAAAAELTTAGAARAVGRSVLRPVHQCRRPFDGAGGRVQGKNRVHRVVGRGARLGCPTTGDAVDVRGIGRMAVIVSGAGEDGAAAGVPVATIIENLE